jgi:hypothetical protein
MLFCTLPVKTRIVKWSRHQLAMGGFIPSFRYAISTSYSRFVLRTRPVATPAFWNRWAFIMPYISFWGSFDYDKPQW